MSQNRKKKNAKRAKSQRRRMKRKRKKRANSPTIRFSPSMTQSQRRAAEPRARRAIKESRSHIKANTEIPEELKGPLMTAEANCRVRGGHVAPIAVIDDAKQFVDVPAELEQYQLLAFLQKQLRESDGNCIQFSFVTENNYLCVIYLGPECGYIAKAEIHQQENRLSISDWQIDRCEKLPTVDEVLHQLRFRRNDTCGCGSGATYKECCAEKAMTNGVTPLPTREEFIELFEQSMREAGVKSTISSDLETFSMTVEGIGTCTLHNLYKAYRDQDADRDDLLRRYVRTWSSAQRGIPEEYADARPDLFPIVRCRSQFEIAEMQSEATPFRPFAEHFAIEMVIDYPEYNVVVSEQQLEEWGVTFDQALVDAIQNLQAIVGEELDCDKPVPGVYVAQPRDDYGSSKILLTNLVRELDVDGEPIAFVPNRGTLLITGSDDTNGLVFAADLAEEGLQRAHPISGLAVRLSNNDVKPFEPPDDHPAYSRIHSLAVEAIGEIYAKQEAEWTTTEEDEFVASFYVLTIEQGHVAGNEAATVSSAVWGEDVTTLLPKVDVIGFIDSEENVTFAPWDRVQDIVGHQMNPLDVYPTRYRVDQFPDAEQLRQLADNEWQRYMNSRRDARIGDANEGEAQLE